MIRTGTARAERRDERGIALSLVALSLVAILGIAALVVDIGNGYRTRRALIPATDAAALAAAQTYVAKGTGCPATASTYLAANESAATMTGCVTSPGSSAARGRVTVTATNNVKTWFAPVIGKGDYTVSSSSTVQWGPPSGATGLRPIGLCYSASGTLKNLIDGTTIDYGQTVTIKIPYAKTNSDVCGSTVPGNWGFIDFSGTASNTPAQSKILLEGYDGMVQFANDMTGPTKSCTGEPHCYFGDPGALAGLAKAIGDLKALDIWFTVPVYDYAELSGSKAKFHLMGALRVKIVSFDVTGSQSGGNNGNGNGSGGGKPNNSGGSGNGNNSGPFFELAIQPGLITGTCCGTTVGTGDNAVLAICAVDPAATGSCKA